MLVEPEKLISGNKFVFSNWKIYCPMGRENLLRYIFSCLFTQYKVGKGSIFRAALQKGKSKPVHWFLFFGFWLGHSAKPSQYMLFFSISSFSVLFLLLLPFHISLTALCIISFVFQHVFVAFSKILLNYYTMIRSIIVKTLKIIY